MAEERKPKIDLKARLQKTQGIPAQTPAPMPAGSSGGSLGGPASVPAPAIPAPMRSSPQSIPAPSLSGVGGGAAGEALGGLARGVSTGPFRAQAEPPPPPPQPQRIEMDEATVHAARRGAYKTAMIAAVGVGFLFGGLGYVIGGAREKAAGHDQGTKDAAGLAEGVAKAKVTLEALKTKTEAARDALLKEGKFPDSLITELGGLNVDFNGGALAGRRFSGFKFETTQDLIGFVTAVQDVNDKKDALVRVLTRLQKPLTERLANATAGKSNVSHVVVLGEKDPSGNQVAILAPLVTPLVATQGKVDAPKDFTFVDFNSKKNVSLERYQGGALTKPAAVYIVPKSLDASFPNEASSGASQIGAQLSGFIRDIKGDDMGGADAIVNDNKPGLLEKATKLETALRNVK